MVYRLPDGEVAREAEEARRREAREAEEARRREAHELAKFERGVRAFPWRAAFLAVGLYLVLPQAGCMLGVSMSSLASHPMDQLFVLFFGWFGGLTAAIILFPFLRRRWIPHAQPTVRTEIEAPTAIRVEPKVRVPDVSDESVPAEEVLLDTEAPARARSRSRPRRA